MHYDPIKTFLGRLFNRYAFTRKLFYYLLDVLLLRSWHIRKALRKYHVDRNGGRVLHVLDAGSGLGQYSWRLARKNPTWQITAIDIKEEEIASCKAFFKSQKVNNVNFRTGNLVNEIHPDAYDLILSVDVMEHIEEDRLVFENFHKSLKRGGMLLISTPSNLGGSDVSAEGDTSFIEEHVRDGYSTEEIRSKLFDAGFNQVSVKYTYGRPGSLAWRISMKYPVLLLGTSRAFLLLLPVYYLIVMPWVLLLNLRDVQKTHNRGTGLLVQAWKKSKD